MTEPIGCRAVTWPHGFNSATPRGRGMTPRRPRRPRRASRLQFGHAQRAWDDLEDLRYNPDKGELASIRPRPEGVG